MNTKVNNILKNIADYFKYINNDNNTFNDDSHISNTKEYNSIVDMYLDIKNGMINDIKDKRKRLEKMEYDAKKYYINNKNLKVLYKILFIYYLFLDGWKIEIHNNKIKIRM